MTCGIYLIKNNITNKMYIGQSIHIEKRIKQHQYKNDLRTSYIENSIAKYGWENFTWQILHECSKEELDIEETKFINLYGTYINGYNLTRGGEMSKYGNPMHNPDLARKQGDTLLNIPRDRETKLKISKTKNKTGFYKVFKEYDSKLKQGFCYRYETNSIERTPIRSINIHKLKEKVISKGFEWIIINEELAKKTIEESDYYVRKLAKKHTTGYYRVSKCNSDEYIRGYYYRYSYYENGKAHSVQATTIEELEVKVLDRDWEWFKLID